MAKAEAVDPGAHTDVSSETHGSRPPSPRDKARRPVVRPLWRAKGAWPILSNLLAVQQRSKRARCRDLASQQTDMLKGVPVESVRP